MNGEGVVAAIEGGLGALLLAWAVRPGGSWLRNENPARLVATAAEMRAAGTTTVETWAGSTEREALATRLGRVDTAACGGLLVVASGVTLASRSSAARIYGIEIGVVGLLVLIACSVPLTSARIAFRERQKAVASQRVDVAISDLADGLTLPKLFTLNRRQLDQYQDLTRRQQRSAFRTTQATSLVAFAALVAGVVIALAVPSTADKVVSGGLAALGSALSGFLASTFFKAHKAANAQLNRYYLEPQRTGRLLAAERLATIDPSLDKAAMTTILDAVMSWEMPSKKEREQPAGVSSGTSSASSPNGATATPG